MQCWKSNRQYWWECVTGSVASLLLPFQLTMLDWMNYFCFVKSQTRIRKKKGYCENDNNKVKPNNTYNFRKTNLWPWNLKILTLT
jgi:hypothetical protein